MKKFKILALVMTCAILLSSIMIPVSAETTGVSIDGLATDGIWANPVATYKLNYNVKNGNYFPGITDTSKSGDVDPIPEANQSTVKIAYDANYLYVYHKGTRDKYVNPTSDMDNNYIGFYFAVVPAGGTFSSSSNTQDGRTTRIFVRTNAKTLAAGTPTTSADGTVKHYTKTNTNELLKQTQYKHNSAYSSTATYDYTAIDAACAVTYNDGTAVKKSVEIKIPLAEAYKTALQTTGGLDLQVQFFERVRIYPENTDSGSSDTGAMMIYDSDKNGTIDTAADKRSYLFNGDFTNAGVALNLPSLNLLADGSKTAPVLVGFQAKDNGNETYDVRFVSVVNEYDGFKFENSKLGYNFTYGSKDDTKYCTKVYETLNANGSEIKATDFGGKYFFCFTIKGLSATEANGYTFGVECFTQKDASSAVETCTNPVTVTVKYNTTTSKVDFTY